MMRYLLPALALCVGSAWGATPGSMVGTSKSGSYFSLNMDGANEVVAEGYVDTIPSYSSVGIVKKVGPKKYRIENERALPSNCAVRKYADARLRSVLLCSPTSASPLNDVMFERVDKNGARQIYLCKKGCNDRIPRQMMYEELD